MEKYRDPIEKLKSLYGKYTKEKKKTVRISGVNDSDGETTLAFLQEYDPDTMQEPQDFCKDYLNKYRHIDDERSDIKLIKECDKYFSTVNVQLDEIQNKI